MTTRKKPTVNTDAEAQYVVFARYFFTHLGNAIRERSEDNDALLGSFVVNNYKQFVNLIEGVPGTVGMHKQLYGLEDEHIGKDR